MATKHTPGPWTANKVTGLVTPTNNPDKDICHAFGQRNLGEGEANARLIAAAPDLLSIVDELLRWAESVEGTSVSAGVVRDGEIFCAARAAIARATGEV